MPFKMKRVYEPPHREDGQRVLVDRLWPRGLSKAAAKVDVWAKEISPSHELRKWYGHDPDRWPEFRKRYAAELRTRKDFLARLRRTGRSGTVTLLFASREVNLNNAGALIRLLRRSAR